jgi:hypothetical protein
MFSEEKASAKKDMVISGEEAVKVADALTATTMRMLQLLSKEPLDISSDRKSVV